jgi:hypothetical protein
LYSASKLTLFIAGNKLIFRLQVAPWFPDFPDNSLSYFDSAFSEAVSKDQKMFTQSSQRKSRSSQISILQPIALYDFCEKLCKLCVKYTFDTASWG